MSVHSIPFQTHKQKTPTARPSPVSTMQRMSSSSSMHLSMASPNANPIGTESELSADGLLNLRMATCGLPESIVTVTRFEDIFAKGFGLRWAWEEHEKGRE